LQSYIFTQLKIPRSERRWTKKRRKEIFENVKMEKKHKRIARRKKE
jgi:hypothetical protein